MPLCQGDCERNRARLLLPGTISFPVQCMEEERRGFTDHLASALEDYGNNDFTNPS